MQTEWSCDEDSYIADTKSDTELIMDNISDESESDWATATEEWGYEEGEVKSMLKKDYAFWHRGYIECSRAQVLQSLDLPGVPEDKNESLLQQ
jgi:hypothetical protein